MLSQGIGMNLRLVRLELRRLGRKTFSEEPGG